MDQKKSAKFSYSALAFLATLLLLLSWSVENLFRGRIDSAIRAADQAKLMQSTAIFQTSVIYDVGEIKQNIIGLSKQVSQIYGKQLPKGTHATEDTHAMKSEMSLELSALQLSVDRLNRVIEDNSIRASAYLGILQGTPIEKDTESKLKSAAAVIMNVRKSSEEALTDYRRTMMIIASRVDAGQQINYNDLEKIRTLVDSYTEIVLPLFNNLTPAAGQLQKAFNDATSELDKYAAKHRRISTFLRWIYVALFIVGSIVSAYSAFKSRK